jgi:hypothetical protein
VVLGAGCGGSTSGSPPPDDGNGQGSLAGPPRPWAELSQEEKRDHMADHVVPAMTERFRSWDAARFANFGCPTCHGSDMAARSFAMPNPSLPALYPTGSQEQRDTVERYPDGVRFMYQVVVPDMGTLLGIPPYDEATGEGMSCYHCHPRGEPAAATPVAAGGP